MAKATKNIMRLVYKTQKPAKKSTLIFSVYNIRYWIMEILPSYYRHFLQLSHFFSFCTLKKVKRIYLHVRMTLPIFIALALLAWSRVLWPFNRLMVGSLLIFAKNLFSFLSSVLTLALLCPVFTLCESALFVWIPILAPLSIILQLPSSQSGCHVYWSGGAANFKSHLSIWHWILRKPELMPCFILRPVQARFCCAWHFLEILPPQKTIKYTNDKCASHLVWRCPVCVPDVVSPNIASQSNPWLSRTFRRRGI